MINPVADALVRLSTNIFLTARNAVAITYAKHTYTEEAVDVLSDYDLDACPSCGNLDLAAPSIWAEGDEISSDNSCGKCDTWWTDEFHITTRRVNLGHTVDP